MTYTSIKNLNYAIFIENLGCFSAHTKGRKICNLHIAFSVCDIFDPDTSVSNCRGWG